MKIKITEKGKYEFYKEVVNITQQYRSLIKKPEQKIKDNIKSLEKLTYADIAIVAFLVIDIIMFGFDSSSIITLIFSILIIITGYFYTSNLKKQVNKMYESAGNREVVIDKKGIKYVNPDVQTISIAWDNIAFIKLGEYTIAFIPKDNTGILICLQIDYKDQILEEIKDKGIKVY